MITGHITGDSRAARTPPGNLGMSPLSSVAGSRPLHQHKLPGAPIEDPDIGSVPPRYGVQHECRDAPPRVFGPGPQRASHELKPLHAARAVPSEMVPSMITNLCWRWKFLTPPLETVLICGGPNKPDSRNRRLLLAGISGRMRASTGADVAGELSTDGAEVSTVCISLYCELSCVEAADVCCVVCVSISVRIRPHNESMGLCGCNASGTPV